MQNTSHDHPPLKSSKPRLRLPFEPHEKDPGEWSYDHRAGICITVILYLILAIIFIWGKLDFSKSVGEGNIIIDFMEETRQEIIPEEREISQNHFEDFTDVRNVTSNENAELNSNLRDAKGMNASEIYREAGELGDKMRANREAYEESLRQEQALIDASRNRNEGTGETQNTKVEGRVTVRFSFKDPVRSSEKLVIPAYMCEGGGEVVVNVVIDVNGNVIQASVDRGVLHPMNACRIPLWEQPAVPGSI